MNAHTLKVERTAHYYTLGAISPEIKHCWMVCHGYGQLASTFVHNFAPILNEETLIVAPEALSRFYWEKFTGPVVASWMTKMDRLDEIEDYSNYLSQLYDLIIPNLHPEVQITLLGFSQGTATQVRWIFNKHPHFHRLILWGGFFPEDLDYSAQKDFWDSKELHFVYGLKDIFLTEKRLAFHNALIKEKALNVIQTSYDGEHRVEKEALETFVQELKGRATKAI